MNLPFEFKVHNAMWRAFEERRNSSVDVDGKWYSITFQDSPRALRTRAIIQGIIFETQNMRKSSENTRAIEQDPSLRTTWGFRHAGNGIRWLTKISSKDARDKRLLKKYDLTEQPNKLVEEVEVKTDSYEIL